jgi:uncharacterized protein
VVVFDGWKGGSGVQSHFLKGGVRIIYSRLGENADAVIKRIVSSEDRQWIVVTSDREIASYAWANGCIPVSSEVFLPIIEGQKGSGGERQAIEGADDEEEPSEQRKGSPRKLSRKEKALRRAIAKL